MFSTSRCCGNCFSCKSFHTSWWQHVYFIWKASLCSCQFLLYFIFCENIRVVIYVPSVMTIKLITFFQSKIPIICHWPIISWWLVILKVGKPVKNEINGEIIILKTFHKNSLFCVIIVRNHRIIKVIILIFSLLQRVVLWNTETKKFFSTAHISLYWRMSQRKNIYF